MFFAALKLNRLNAGFFVYINPTIMKSTHLADFGAGKIPALCIVCGQYYRQLRTTLFGGDTYISKWSRIPDNVTLIPCVADMIEKRGNSLLNTSDNIK